MIVLEILGTLHIPVKLAGIVFDIEFHVIDIQPSTNLILGRPWLHKTKAVPSTLHQKLNQVYEGAVITVHGDVHPLDAEASTLEAEREVEITRFSIDSITVAPREDAEEEEAVFATYVCRHEPVLKMMNKMNYFPYAGLERGKSWIVNPIILPRQTYTFGLGYKPTERDLQKMEEQNGLQFLMEEFPLLSQLRQEL